MATETKPNVLKLKPNQDGSSSSKGKPVLKKTETSSSKLPHDSKRKSATVTVKSEVKGKTTASSSKTVVNTTQTGLKFRQRKTYSLPGQKYDTPEEREPLRIFYESLSKQIPSSEMAEFWMMEHGLLSPDRAKKAYERKQRRQQQIRSGIPIKSPPKQDKPGSSQKQQFSKNGDLKGKKRVVNDSDDDDDFILKRKKPKGAIRGMELQVGHGQGSMELEVQSP